MSATLCPLAHRHAGPADSTCTRCGASDRKLRDCPRRADPHICVGHITGLKHQLAELPGLHADLLSGTKRGPQPKTSRTGHSEITLNGKAVKSRADIAAVLASWVKLTAEQIGASRLPPEHVLAMASWLAGRLETVSRCEWVIEMASELSGLHSAARRIAHPSGSRRFDVARCPEITTSVVETHLEQQCPGMLRARLSAANLWDSDLSTIVCTVCGRSTEPRYWLALGSKVHAA